MIITKVVKGIFVFLLFFILMNPSLLFADQVDTIHRWDIGLDVNYPLTLSMPLFLLSEKDRMIDGFMLQFEPGINGGKLQAGYSINLCTYEWPTTLSIKATFLRTWGEPLYLEPYQNYLGVETEYYFAPFTFHIGYLQHIAGYDEDNDNFISYGIGFVLRNCVYVDRSN